MLAPGFRVLDERERMILHLRFFEGLTQSQIAQQVGISQMHVSRLIRRSLEKIREEIASEEQSRRRGAERESRRPSVRARTIRAHAHVSRAACGFPRFLRVEGPQASAVGAAGPAR